MTDKKTEHAFKYDAHRWLSEQQRRGVLWFVKIHGSGMQRAGVPDFLLCVNGYFLAVELKRPGARGKAAEASPAQAIQMAKIERAGGVSGVVLGLENLKKAVEALLAIPVNENCQSAKSAFLRPEESPQKTLTFRSRKIARQSPASDTK